MLNSDPCARLPKGATADRKLAAFTTPPSRIVGVPGSTSRTPGGDRRLGLAVEGVKVKPAVFEPLLSVAVRMAVCADGMLPAVTATETLVAPAATETNPGTLKS